MNQNTALALTITASAVAGALVTASVLDTRITDLKNNLRKAEFKIKLMKRANDAMLDVIPDDCVSSVLKKIKTDVEFEVLTHRL